MSIIDDNTGEQPAQAAIGGSWPRKVIRVTLVRRETKDSKVISDPKGRRGILDRRGRRVCREMLDPRDLRELLGLRVYKGLRV